MKDLRITGIRSVEEAYVVMWQHFDGIHMVFRAGYLFGRDICITSSPPNSL